MPTSRTGQPRGERPRATGVGGSRDERLRTPDPAHRRPLPPRGGRSASGGMGTVWRGQDELLGRPVAVKEVRFPPELGEQEQAELRKRTLREARATASLSHPNVVTTYDVVEEDGLPYIVMELLRGLQPERPPARGRPPARRTGSPRSAWRCSAPSRLSHRKGVVHRDVKPGNVLINDDGRAILTDFGIATMAGDPALTSTGVVLGSPAYMSPERARGQKPGPEADMWSLGATLYSAAEGRPPYDGDNALGTLTAVISDPVEPPRVGGPLARGDPGPAREGAGRPDEHPADPRAAGEGRSRPLGRRPRATTLLDRRRAAALPTAASRTEALPRRGRRAAARRWRPAGPSIWPTDDAPSPARRPEQAARLPPCSPSSPLLLGLARRGRLDAARETTRPTLGPDRPPRRASRPARQASTTRTRDHAAEDAAARRDGVPPASPCCKDPTGFPVAVPDGWEPVAQRLPASTSASPAAHGSCASTRPTTPSRTPKKDWEQPGEVGLASGSPTTSGSSIESVDYRDYDGGRLGVHVRRAPPTCSTAA